MGNVERGNGFGEESLDGMLKALFGASEEEERESVLLRIGRVCGEAPEVLLRDPPDEHAPVLRGAERDGAVEDDSRYHVLGEIGRGGVGIVYQARDRDLGRSVALKVLRPEHADNVETVKRFVEEAQVEGQLQHPGIVPVHGLGLQPDGRPFFTMKLVRGKTLAELLAERDDPAEGRARFLSAFERTALALAYAHERGVVHRDLKPANVMTGMFGEVQVMDWGFAKVLGRGEEEEKEEPDQTIIATVRSGKEGSASIAGSVMGTPAYMPPEQARGRVDEVDQRADVFALGAVLTEILTGSPPYVGDRADLLTMAMQARLDDALARLDGCGADRAWIDLAKRCLSPVRADRPLHAGAVADEVHRIVSEAEERARQAEIHAAKEKVRREREKARLAEERLRTKRHTADEAQARARAEGERREAAIEARRALAEKSRRRALVLLAASLCFVVAVGVAGLLWSRAESAGRLRETENRVTRALQDAEAYAGREEWGPAAEAARSAVALAAGARAETRSRAEAISTRIEAARAAVDVRAVQAENDRAMVARMEEAFLALFAGDVEFRTFDPAPADRELTAAFREYGLDLDEASEEEIVSFLSESAIREDFVGAFDHWLGLISPETESRNDPDGAYGRRADRLLRVLHRLDSDPYRNEVRAAIRSRDIDRLWKLFRPERLATCRPRFVEICCVTLLERECCNEVRFDRAIPVLRDALGRAPDDFWLHHGLATVSYWAKSYSDSLPHREITVSLRPRSPGLWSRLAWTRFRLGDVAGARAALDRAKELAPGYEIARLLEAWILYDSGDARGAVALAEAVLRDRPASRHALRIKGLALERVGDRQGAARTYERAVEVAPRAHGPRQPLSRLYWHMGRWDEAIELLREAIRSNPRADHAYYWLGHFLIEDGRNEEAVEALEKAVAIVRGDATLLALLGGALVAVGRLEEAESRLAEAFRLEPENGSAWRYLCGLHEARGDWEAKLETARRAVRAAPTSGTYLSLGTYLADFGDHPGALEALREAERLSGKAADINLENEVVMLCNAARSLTGSGRWEEGRALLERALALDPNDAYVHQSLAVLALEDRDSERALACCERALLWKLSPAAWAMKGEALFRMGRVKDAVVALERSQALDAERSVVQGGRLLGPRGGRQMEGLLDAWKRVLPFEARRAEVLSGEVVPDDPRTALGLALFCAGAERHDTACRYFGIAFGGDLDEVLESQLGFAADSAVRSGTRQGRDQALAWLRLDLGQARSLLATGDFMDRVDARHELWFFRRSMVLAKFRAGLGDLPEEEREGWRELWRDADALLESSLGEGE